MKLHILTAVSGIALSAVLLASPAGAWGGYSASGGDRVDANGMPTTHSTPEEQAQTAELNNQAAASAVPAQDQTSAKDAQYQAQRQRYQLQQQQYQDQIRDHEAQQERYEDLRARYAAERAAYQRDFWPEHHWTVVGRNANAIGERVELISGNHVGTVVDTAHAANGDIEALLVRLDNDKVVWIDSMDVRFNRSDGVVMTDLGFDDLRRMANERL
jgi:hypothetical protein